MADCFTEERFQLLRALGAEINMVPSAEGRPRVTARAIANMVARAAELERDPTTTPLTNSTTRTSPPDTETGSDARYGGRRTAASPRSARASAPAAR
jgi:hypothetical protein